MIASYRDLRVYQCSYALAMDIFRITKEFPKEELYSLTDQIRRSSRSVTVNIVEGWAKRHYQSIFKRHLVDSIGSCDESKVWVDFAFSCDYISKDEHSSLMARADEIGKMLHGLFHNWRTIERKEDHSQC